MYGCTYVRMYVCTYVRMYVCTYLLIYVFRHVRMNACTYVSIYVYTTYVCTTYVCTYVRMYVCMYICTYVRIYWLPRSPVQNICLNISQKSHLLKMRNFHCNKKSRIKSKIFISNEFMYFMWNGV